MKNRKVFLNVEYGVISQVIKILLQFLSRRVFIYYLGVEYLGVNSLFASILSILSMAELGVGSAVAFSLYKPISENNEKKIAGIMCLYRKVYRIIGLVVLAVGCMLLPFIPQLVNTTENIPYLRFLFFIVLLKTSLTYLLFAYSQTLLIAAERKYEVDRVISLFYIITNVAEILVLFFTRSFMLYLVVDMVCLIIQQYVIYRRANHFFPDIMQVRGAKLDKQETREIWKNVYGLSISKFAGAILSSIDSIVISTFISTAVVGIYSNYTMVLAAATGIMSMIFTSVTANVGIKFADGSITEEHFNIMFYINYLICGFCTIMYTLLIDDFISIFFGSDLVLSKWAVAAIAFNLVITYLQQTVQVFKDASGIFWYGKYRPLVTCLLNIIFSVVFARPFGIAGIVFATALSRILTTLWYDPYLVFKYAYKKGMGRYIVNFIIYFILIFLAVLVGNFTTNLIIGDRCSIIWFFVKAGIVFFESVVTLVVFTLWKKECRWALKYLQKGIRK